MNTRERFVNMTMLTDFYELTMANGYLKAGFGDTIAYFDAFFRKVPDDGGFAIMAGLEQIIEYLTELRFTEEAGDISGTSFDVAVKDFYAMLYRAVMNGEALDIPAERAAQVIAVVEYCHAQNPLPVKFD